MIGAEMKDREYVINGDELQDLLIEHDVSVSEFAVLEAKLNPQTIYKAINGGRLKPKSFRSISRAMDRLRRTSTKSTVAG